MATALTVAASAVPTAARVVGCGERAPAELIVVGHPSVIPADAGPLDSMIGRDAGPSARAGLAQPALPAAESGPGHEMPAHGRAQQDVDEQQ